MSETTSKRTLIGRVVSDNGGPFVDTVIVNVGRAQGAKSGDAVTYNGKDEKGNAISVTSKKEGDDAKLTVKNEKGTMTAEVGKDKVSEKDLGVAFYPGATVETGMDTAQSGEKAAAMQIVTLKSADPMEKVSSFYKGKYAKGNSVVEAGGRLLITVKSGEAAGKMTIIRVARDKQGTLIMIQSMKGM